MSFTVAESIVAQVALVWSGIGGWQIKDGAAIAPDESGSDPRAFAHHRRPQHAQAVAHGRREHTRVHHGPLRTGLHSAHLQSPCRGLGKAARWPRRRPGVARPPQPPLARAQMRAMQLAHQGPHNLANTRHREVKLNSRLGTPQMAGFIPSTERPWKLFGEPPPLYTGRATTRRHCRARLGNTPHSGNRYGRRPKWDGIER